MKVENCTDAYVPLCGRIFQKWTHHVAIKGKVQTRFDTDELGGAMEDIVERQGLGEGALLKDDPDVKYKSVGADTGH